MLMIVIVISVGRWVSTMYQYHLNFSLSLDESTSTPETLQTAQSIQTDGSSLQSPSEPCQGTATSSSNPCSSQLMI